MFVFGHFFIAVARILDIVLWAMSWVIFIRVIISWVNPDPFNPIVQFLIRTTEPILQPIRSRLPYSAIDFSPLVAWLIIVFLQRFLVPVLLQWGSRLL